MQTVSSTFDRLFKAHADKVVAVSVKKANGSYDGFDQDTDYVYNQNTRLVSLSTNHALMDAPLKVGKCVVQEVNLVVRDPGSIPRAGEFKIGLKLDDGTTQSEWIQKGTFYVDTRKLDKETNELVIRGYDAMLKTEERFIKDNSEQVGEVYTVWKSNSDTIYAYNDMHRSAKIDTLQLSKIVSYRENSESIMEGDYIIGIDGIVKVYSIVTISSGTYAMWRSNNSDIFPTNWPRTDILVVGEIAKRIGIKIEQKTLEFLAKGYSVQFVGYGEAGYTMREVLGYIGAMYAGNWCISNTNMLRLIPVYYSDLGYLKTEEDYRLTMGGSRIIIG